MILIANALHIPLKDESVHCVVTSPPYYGLRKYDIPDLIWDGEAGCKHEWGDFLPNPMKPYENQVPQTKYTNSSSADGQNTRAGQFCSLCGAWRGSLGLEPTPELYVQHLVEIMREVRRVLRDDGTLWLVLGDSYWGGKGQNGSSKARRTAEERGYTQSSGTVLMDTRPQDGQHDVLKAKDLVGIPWRVAFALQADGWWLRSDIIWTKPNCMPESVTDRPTKSHEYVFLLSKSATYFYDNEAIKEPLCESSLERMNQPTFDQQTGGPSDYAHGVNPNRSARKALENLEKSRPSGRNKRDVWTVPTSANHWPADVAHFATFPPALIEPMIKAGTSEKGCCPKCGSPWKREVEKTFVPQQDVSLDRGIRGATGQKPMDASSEWDGVPRGSNVVKTIGWQPTCSCDAGDPVPCVVMDPFAGSGTTGVVAEKLNRRWVGLDLGYLELQQERLVGIQKEMPLIG